MKSGCWLVAVFAAALLFGGCAWALRATPAEASGPTRADARRVHWVIRYDNPYASFSPERRELIASKYGEEYLPKAERLNYIHIPTWKWQRHADVFEVQGRAAEGSYSLIVCVHQGRVAEIYLKESPLNVPGEFLRQFVGRSLEDSFEVAQSAEDAFGLPAKLHPIGGNLELSKAIATDLRKVLI